MNTTGTHFIVELHDCPPGLADDPRHCEKAIVRAIERSGLTLIDQLSHQFRPQGFTAIALLAESHLSVHTWPEAGYIAADLFTCGDARAGEAACQQLVAAFRPADYSITRLTRGDRPRARASALAGR